MRTRKAESLPARGAWIEICQSPPLKSLRRRRSPHGEHGLKCLAEVEQRIDDQSLPARGAWIEIVGKTGQDPEIRSLPARGAWIEI